MEVTPAPIEDEVRLLHYILSGPTRNGALVRPSELTTPAATEYLHHITSLSLSELQAEPGRLQEEAAEIEGELTNLCFREHRTFIEVHRCADDVQHAFEEFGDSLDRLLDAVPPLEKECEAFAVSTRGIQQDRRKATLVLEHQDKLLDLLEIPQLVDTCVRNGYYQEAMELSAHANSLVKRYGDVPIVLSVQAEVARVMQLQLSQLLALLREPVKLPMLVKAVGFLRRMGDLPEDELRIAFLESRESYFRTLLEQLERDKTDKVRYTRRYIDLFRENVYDTISQYGSIFLDPILFPQEEQSTAMDAAVDVLVIYCHHALDSLLQVIYQTFPHIPDTSSLSSLLTQLGYCSLSFARVGMDFSAYIVKPFEDAVLNLTILGLSDAKETILLALKEATRLSRVPSAWMCSSEAVPEILASPSSPPEYPELSGSLSSPPSYLTFYPPLAIYLNAALSTLNSLRLLAPLSLMQAILTHLEQSLASIIYELVAYAQAILIETSNVQTRPAGTRRNPGVGNQGVAIEIRAERSREARRVLCAFAGALLHGVEGFVRRALVEGVYEGARGTLEDLTTDPLLEQAVGELRQWIEEHGERPSEQEFIPTNEISTKVEDEAHLANGTLGHAHEHDVTQVDTSPDGRMSTEVPEITAEELDRDITALEENGSNETPTDHPVAILDKTIAIDGEQSGPKSDDVDPLLPDVSVSAGAAASPAETLDRSAATASNPSELNAVLDVEVVDRTSALEPLTGSTPQSPPSIMRNLLDHPRAISSNAILAEPLEATAKLSEPATTHTTRQEDIPVDAVLAGDNAANETEISRHPQASEPSAVLDSAASGHPTSEVVASGPLADMPNEAVQPAAKATETAVAPIEPNEIDIRIDDALALAPPAVEAALPTHTTDDSDQNPTSSAQTPDPDSNVPSSLADDDDEHEAAPSTSASASTTNKSTSKSKKKKKGKK